MRIPQLGGDVEAELLTVLHCGVTQPYAQRATLQARSLITIHCYSTLLLLLATPRCRCASKHSKTAAGLLQGSNHVDVWDLFK